MNTTEINGFPIDKFNIYDLKTGAKESTCPLCSHTRSASNQKKKPMLLDWERGIGTCMHCGVRLQLHSFKRKTDSKDLKRKMNMQTRPDRLHSFCPATF